MKIRAFTLLEVLIAMTIVSLVAVGSMALAHDYVESFAWKNFKENLEQVVWQTNVASLARFSSSPDDAIPDRYELSFSVGDFSFRYQEKNHDTLVFEKILLLENDLFQVQKISMGQASWSRITLSFIRPFGKLSFEADQKKVCEKNPCELTVTFARPGRDEKKIMILDQEKNIEFSL